MRIVRKTLIGILFIFYLYSVSVLPASASSPEALSFYEDGDTVGFIGDSITYASYTSTAWPDALFQYYLSRFPEREIEFRNLSAAGYKVIDILNIYDRDPAFRDLDRAVIMLGTNEAILGISTEEYIGNMAALIGLLKEEGLSGEDILILSPPVCDENCSLNYDANGNRRWTYEATVLKYMARLETEAAEWGVHYLDLHTPMAALTEIMQQENPANTLTTDCIHPNALGQMLIAHYILQAQGAGEEFLSELIIPAEGEAQALRNESANLYRGEKGACLTLKPKALPLPDTRLYTELHDFLTQHDLSDAMYESPLRAEGFSENISYELQAGETLLGAFSGQELTEGIDLAALETHPTRQLMNRTEALIRQRHRETVDHRAMWIEVMMQRADFTPEQIQETYEQWKSVDEELRREIYAIVREAKEETFYLTLAENGFSVTELEEEAEAARKAAAEQAAREAEEARKAAEKAQREAEEARKAAEEKAAKEAEEARKAAEEAQREAEEQAAKEAHHRLLLRGILIGGGILFFLSAGAAVLIIHK